MTVTVQSDDLHVGRDSNDTTWLVVRYADDWAKTVQSGLYYDPLAQVVELAPQAPSSTANDGPLCTNGAMAGSPPAPVPQADQTMLWLPLDPVTDENGDQYRSDPASNHVLRQRACDASFTPLPHFGGLGFETGRLDNPLGLALDGRGFLYVADACNHRVQVVRPDDGSVVVVMGAVDNYGRPVAGITGGAMTEPVDVAVDPCHCWIFVADRTGGRIHVFNRRFEWVRSFEPQPSGPRPPGERAMPIAVAVDSDGNLLIADAHWPRLLHAAPDGTVLAEVVLRAGTNPHFAGLVLSQQYALDATALIGPLDCGVYDSAWHKVLVDADVPLGTGIEVQTFACNDPSTVNVAQIAWGPATPVRIVSTEVADDDGYQRLILSDTSRWERSVHGAYRRARPSLATFSGGGPNAAATLATIPAAAMQKVRIGDTLRFTAGLVTGTSVITALPQLAVSLFIEGDGALYGTGARLSLGQRAGEDLPGGPRVIYTFAAADLADFTTVLTDGTSSDVSVPHGAAAFFRSGDVYTLTDGIHVTTLVVDELRFLDTPATITAASADFRTSVMTLETTPGRLIAADLGGYETTPPPSELIHVVDGSNHTVNTTVILAEPDVAALWIDPAPMVAVTFDSWVAFTTDPGIATDRGQFLWVLLRLVGRTDHPASPFAVDTPAVRSLRMLYQRPSYLAYLPATYGRRDNLHDPSGALFLERYLTLFEGSLTRSETLYEGFSRLLNPDAAPPEWLNWLASWLDLVFNPSWPIDKRRKLVLNAVDLYRRRGTPKSIGDWVEIYTGIRPTIVEGFQMRGTVGLVLGGSPLGVLQLLDEDQAADACQPVETDAFANRFTIYLYINDVATQPVVESTVRALVESMKPAHTAFDLTVVRPHARIGLQSAIGLDFVLGDDPRPPRSILGLGVPPSSAGDRFRPILGLDTFLADDPSHRAAPAAAMSEGGVRIDSDLRLK